MSVPKRENGVLRRAARAVVTLWCEARSRALVFLAIASALATAYASFEWRSVLAGNETILALENGRDIEIDPGERAEILLARIAFLTKRDEVDRARAYLDALDRRGDAGLSAQGHYVLANALLRKAFDTIEKGELDAATPFVTLAKRDYRSALEFSPEYWNAKFNLDVATRLVHDYADFERKSGDELYADPKKLWTDIPGAPKGLP